MEKEASCITSKYVIEYLKVHYDGEISRLLANLDPEIDAAPDPVRFLRDSNNWISCGVISEIYRRVRQVLDDDMAAYKIGKHFLENLSLGRVPKIVIKVLWSYKNVLKNAQKLNDKWNRTKKIELIEIGKTNAVIRFHWDKQMDLSKDICLANQGTLAYLPLLWGGKPVELEEKSCFFEGDSYCEYHLRWPARNRFHEIFSRFFTTKSVLKETILEMENDKKLIEEKYNEVNRLNVTLNQKVKQLLAIQETGKAILSVLDLEQLLTVIMSLLNSACKINRAIIMLMNKEKKSLEYIHGSGFENGVPENIRNYRVPLDRVNNLLARAASTGKAEYVPRLENSYQGEENILLRNGKPASIYVVPLITRSKVIGVIVTDAASEEGISRETRETMEIFAPQIAIAIENARLYSALQEQMKALRRSHVLLSRTEKFSFLGNLAARLAHEIKNPMTSIATFFQLLPQKYDDQEFRQDFYKIAMEETLRINNLITELLDLVKTKESHFEFSGIHELIDRMVLLVSPQSNEKRIEIVKDYDTTISLLSIDAEKIKQVILNLLSNAVDFTPMGGRIAIKTKNAPADNGPHQVHIEISDNGEGIPDAYLEKIFDPYFTTKHRSNLHNGTGLGLFIAHQNMQDHGGAIEVRSGVEEGATFTLKLPVIPS